MSFNPAAANQPSKLARAVSAFKNHINNIESNADKIEEDGTRKQLTKKIRDLKVLDGQINENLETDPEADKYRGEYEGLLDRYHKIVGEDEGTLESRIKKIDEQRSRQEQAQKAEAEGNTEEAQKLQQEDAEAAEIELISHQAKEIAEDMAELKDTTNEVHNEIEKQHAQLRHIDEVVTEAKDNMVDGNKELEIAEKHQKKTCEVL